MIPPKKLETKRTYLPANKAWSANVNAIQKAAAVVTSFISGARCQAHFPTRAGSKFFPERISTLPLNNC
jgi:hypothetical protein